ncbi:MAG: glycosyl hydrolase family protein [Ruminiclostridium sp.]|nr:glycosyl hydrolase family protein [Ruminiclostridium sp.]
MVKSEVFLYGAQYYRPPNPPRDQHFFHLNRIKNELGFNVIKVFFEWSYMHTGPNKFDFEEQDEIFDICDRLGLNVLIQTRLESSPYWLEKRHPEARYISANGSIIELGPNGNTQCGGYPGLCFHHDAIRQEGENFLMNLTAHFKGRKSLIGYDCWNEPHLEPAWIDNTWVNMGDRLFCYCDATRNAFRIWLKGKYGDVDHLNKIWTRKYSNWDEINPPNRQGHYADWLDWSRFWFDDQKKHMQWRYDTIKGQDADRFVMSHSGAVPPFLPRANAFINNWAFAEPVDIWGTSMAPRYMNWSFAECAGILELTRSAARGKDFWISELTGGSCNRNGFVKTPITRPQDVRTWNWLGVVYGAKAVVYWCYLTESTGLEAGSYGLAEYNGKITERAREAAVQADLIRKNYNLIRDFSIKADIAILYDPDNSSLLFAMEGKDDLYGNSHIGYYRCVWENDLYARYITYDTIDELEEKILIVPMCLTINEVTAQKIKSFVKRGGILIAEARMGLFDEKGFLQPDLPSFGLTEAAGLREEEALYSNPDNRPFANTYDNANWAEEAYGGPEISILQSASANFGVHGYLAPLITEGAECTGKWKNICLAAHNRYGSGEVYYFGTYLGLALYNKDKGAYKLVTEIFSKYAKPRVSGDRLRPRIIEKNKEGLLAVFNDSRIKKCSECIILPQGYKYARNLFSGEDLVVEDGCINVTVETEDVLVIHMSMQGE